MTRNELASTEESVHLHIDAHPLEDWLTALSIARAGQARALAEPGDEAWGAVWLYCNWRAVTQQMGTGARELAAAAVLRWMHALDAVDGRPAREAPEELRWWTT